MTKIRDYTLCPRCETNPRVVRPSGTLRSWCSACEVRQKAQYVRSAAGKIVWKRWYHGTWKAKRYNAPCWWCGKPTGWAFTQRRAFHSGECTRAARKQLRALRNAGWTVTGL